MASVAPRLASGASPLRLASALLVAACSADPGAPAAPIDAAPADVAAPPPDAAPDAAPDATPDAREPPPDAVIAPDAAAPDAVVAPDAAPDAPADAAPDATPADAPPDVDPRMIGTFRFGVEAALNLVIDANGTYRWHRDDCAAQSGACGRWTRSGDMIALSGESGFGEFPWVVGTLAEPVAAARVSLAADGSGVVVRGMGGGRAGRPFEQTWTRGAACATCAGGMQSGPPSAWRTGSPRATPTRARARWARWWGRGKDQVAACRRA